MIVTGEGHWHGDATRFCGRLKAEAQTQTEAKDLATLLRVLSDPVGRRRLVELAERVEAEEAALADPVLT